jgi:hypothetical protein
MNKMPRKETVAVRRSSFDGPGRALVVETGGGWFMARASWCARRTTVPRRALVRADERLPGRDLLQYREQHGEEDLVVLCVEAPRSDPDAHPISRDPHYPELAPEEQRPERLSNGQLREAPVVPDDGQFTTVRW